MKIKHFMYLLALVLMINLNACSSDSPEEEIPEVPPQEEPGTDPNVPQGADIVVSPNTLLLKDGLDKYVDNPVEGSTLSLNTGVQASELPEVGRVLLYGGISDKFPLGFLGKVSKVEKTATGYDIETEPASLEETFDKLYVNDTLDIELDDTALAQSRAIKSHKDAEGYTGLQTRFEFPLGKDLNGIEGWEVGDLSASLEGRVIYGVGLAMKLHCFMDMDKAKGKKPHIEFGFFLKTESGLDATLEGSLGIAPSTYSKDLWDILIKPAVLAGGVGQVVSLIVTPHFTGKLFTEINGEVDFAAEAHHKDKWEIKYVYKDGKSELLPPTHQNIREDPFKPTSVKLKGKYSAGMAAAVEVRLFNIKEASCGVQMKAGPAIEGNIIYEDKDGTDLIYSKLKDCSLAFTPLNVNGSLSAKVPLFTKEAGSGASMVPFSQELFSTDVFPKTEFFLFPDFEPSEPFRLKDDIYVAYTASRLTLFPYEFGLRLTDDSNKIVADHDKGEVESKEHGSGTEKSTHISTTFTETDPKKTYYVRPTLKAPIFKTVIPAEPVVTLKGTERTERDALIALYQATDGDHWAVNTNWCSDKPLSEWYGITTDSKGKVTTIDLAENKLNGVFELSDFQELKKILCGNQMYGGNTSAYNQIKEVNFQKCPKLHTISFAYSSVEKFVAKDCQALYSLDVSQNLLTDLDLSSYPNLAYLTVYQNQLTKLDLSKNALLHSLSCSDNPLGELALSHLSKLDNLNCRNAQLTALDLSGLSNLTALQCDKNPITALDLSPCPKLRLLWCTESDLASLDVSGLQELEYVNCPFNKKMETFYARHNPKLVKIWLGESFGGGTPDALKVFEAVDCPALEEILCLSTGTSTSYVLKGCNALQKLACSNSGVPSLDLRECPNLRELACDLCNLKTLDVTPCRQLQELFCGGNPLTSLNMSTNGALLKIYCHNCTFDKLDVYAASNLNELNAGKHKTIRLRNKPAHFQCEEWGEYDLDKYKEPNHIMGHQYPELIFY